MDRVLQRKKCSVIPPDLPLVLDFLTMLHENGLSHSTVNTARSMLSSILQLNVNSSLPIGQLPIVKRFMKGIFEFLSSLPRYTATWDLSTVLKLFPQRYTCISTFLKGVDFKADLFVDPFEWTRMSNSQILFNRKCGALRP